MDLAHDFLENIFKCDQSGHLAVLIQNNRDVKCRFTHFHEKLRYALVFVGKMRLPHNIADIKGLVTVIQEEIFHINNTDDIVL